MTTRDKYTDVPAPYSWEVASAGDARFTWFFVVLSLFTSAMLDVVIAPNLIQLLVGVNFWGSGTRAVAIALVVTAVVTLVGIFHPDSLAALESDS